jgi:hypothetical protein
VINASALQVSMLTKILSFDKIDGFRLRICFNDGSTGVHDFASVVLEPGTMVASLLDPVYFQRVFLEFGALTGPNGFDIAPEWLGREMVQAAELTTAAA